MLTFAIVVLFIAACVSASVRRGLAYVAGFAVFLLAAVYFWVDERNAQEANRRWYAANCPRILATDGANLLHANHATIRACQAYRSQ